MNKLVICPHCVDGQVHCPVCRGGSREIACPDCRGLGLYYDSDGEKARSCPRCEGEGYVDPSECVHCFDGVIDCEICHGSGELVEDECQTCGGSERLRCFECKGTGEVENEEDVLDCCPECDGEGLVICPDCE